MVDSILTTIKKMLGIESNYTAFDSEIVAYINSALMSLTQLGVGPETGFSIEGSAEVWTDFLGDSKTMEAVKTYIHQKVKLIFDPPTSSFVVDAINRNLLELEWRLCFRREIENAQATQ